MASPNFSNLILHEMRLSLANPAATHALGVCIGRALLAHPALVLLQGDLGAGKTATVRGVAEGMGLDARGVRSPTFSLVHRYCDASASIILYHADLYRLRDENSLSEDITGLLEDADSRLCVEWPGGIELAWKGPLLELHLWHTPAGAREATLRTTSETLWQMLDQADLRKLCE